MIRRRICTSVCCPLFAHVQYWCVLQQQQKLPRQQLYTKYSRISLGYSRGCCLSQASCCAKELQARLTYSHTSSTSAWRPAAQLSWSACYFFAVCTCSPAQFPLTSWHFLCVSHVWLGVPRAAPVFSLELSCAQSTLMLIEKSLVTCPSAGCCIPSCCPLGQIRHQTVVTRQGFTVDAVTQQGRGVTLCAVIPRAGSEERFPSPPT